MFTRRVAPLLLAAILLGACGSDDDPVVTPTVPTASAQDLEVATEPPVEAPIATTEPAPEPTAAPEPAPDTTEAPPVLDEPTPTPTAVTEAEIIQAYLLSVQAITASGQPPDPNFEPLLELVAEPIRSRVIDLRSAQLARGDYLEGEPERFVIVTALTDTDAVVRVCVLDLVVRYNQAGEVESPAADGHTVIVASLKPEDNVWKIYESIGNGEPCDPADFQ